MLEVLIPLNPDFQFYEYQIKELYEKNQKKIKDPNSFSFIKNNTFFYIFILNGTLIGAIYYFIDNKKLYLNGFAYPKNHLINLHCLRLSTTWFNCDIYAEAQNKASALCLIKSGFKRVKDNIFILKKQDK